ncbi:hypothetical protein OE88DRAFT_1739236 [Heliocybe sulcata]|uniref:Transmembrane protein n=1 Tax=Heliocybe sulcata TaxID=5364 RepID=A0A5C3MPD4_9AGAM|nr:hypothetical protein OE88DRAFT_1739236 [Heliocybe sulcata]
MSSPVPSRPASSASPLYRSLFPRKGGGGHGHGGKGGKSSGSHSDPSRASFTLGTDTGASGKSATAYSAGGGKPFVMSSNSPFAGRQAGGGTRGQVYGTWTYGSGYPYGSHGPYVSDRPFPYVFWPIPIEPGYYGSDEYDDRNGTARPGGHIATATIVGNGFPGTTDIYRIIGDQLSVNAVMDALVTNCTVKNATLESFDPRVYAYPRPEQIVQWYRASSFGLGLDSYNNTAALPSNMPSSNTSALPSLDSATRLPSGLNMTFLACINTTIAASVPLVDASGKKHLSHNAIFGIVFGVLFGAAAILIVLYQVCKRRPRNRAAADKNGDASA